MKIKSLLAILFTLTIITVNYAQLYKTKSKITLRNGKKLVGYVKKKNNSFAFYKNSKSKDYDIISYPEIKIISINTKEGYREFHMLRNERTNKHRLMILLTKGKINLYKSFNINRIRKINNEEDLSYAISRNGKTYKIFHNFKKEARVVFKDCPFIINKLNNREFSRLDLSEMVLIYNDDCIENIEPINEEPKKPIVKTKPKKEIKPKEIIEEKPKEVVKIITKKPLNKAFKKVKNKIIVNLNPIYFTLNKAEIREDANAELDKVVLLMNENPLIKIEAGSHTDSRGSDNYNLKLSTDRANATMQYIINKGINADRITAIGYGETQLNNHCTNNVACTEVEHQQNRRTEFVILNPEVINY